LPGESNHLNGVQIQSNWLRPVEIESQRVIIDVNSTTATKIKQNKEQEQQKQLESELIGPCPGPD